ncbi:MAG: ATP synthase F1 subunit delta [Luteitalea sp.]|nr:ATP synthase F1 subunit delta [Luteitalea sp.]
MTRLEATRAARALFDVSLQQGDPAHTASDLTRMVELLDAHRDLETALTSPMVKPAAKHALVDQLAPRLDLTSISHRLLLALADRDRLATIRPIAAAFHRRMLEHQRVMEAAVTTAVPLSEEQAAAIAAGLSRATGRRVSLVRAVDPSIIGGAVARVGSLVFDGSITTQLRRFKEQLSAEV